MLDPEVEPVIGRHERFGEVFADIGQNLFLILIQGKPAQQADNDDETTQPG